MSSRVLAGWLFACSALALAAPAAAQDCATDADCGSGFVCESFGTVECGYACPEGEKCPDMPADCEPMELKGCVPAPCNDDSECPDDMVCFAQTYTECSGVAESGGDARPAAGGSSGGGAAGADGEAGADAGPPQAEPECKEVTDSRCAPKYVPPCKEDADCGEGFTCKESESCRCSGSAGAGSAGGDGGGSTPPEPAEPDCTCEKTGDFYCELVETACESADECPDGFTCDANPSSVVCSPPATDAAGTGGASGSAGAEEARDGGAAEDPCAASTAPEKVCLPPYWDKGFGGGGRGGDAFAESGAAGGTLNDAPMQQATKGGDLADDGSATGSEETAASMGGDDGGICSVALVGDARSRERAGVASLGTALALLALALRRRRTA